MGTALHFKILAVLWFIFMLFVLFMPGSSVPEVSFSFPHFDKLIHFTLFAVFTFLLQKALTPPLFARTILLLFLFAGGSEIIQELYIPRRSGDILDFIANSTGIIFSIILTSYRFQRDRFTE